MLEGIGNEAQARRALDEIERVMADAARSGVAIDPWLGELADELRAAWPEIDAAGAAALARRVAARPGVSLAAQGGVKPEVIRALRP